MVARVIPQRFFQVVVIAVLALAVAGPVLAQSEESQNATQSLSWKGGIAITTSSDGLWTFVTVAAREGGMPLQAAFVLQHLPPVPSPMNTTFSGTAELLSRPHELPGVAVWVTAKQGNCSFFRLGDYKGAVPHGCQTVDLAGIARYERTTTQDTLPSTHSEFVDQVLPVLEREGPHLAAGGQVLDDCTSCPNGGEGSGSCSSGPVKAGVSAPEADCSVECRTGYYSCCNLTCVCCKPSLSPTGSLLTSPSDPLAQVANGQGSGSTSGGCTPRSASVRGVKQP